MCLIVLVVYFDVMVCYLIVVDCAFLLLLLTVACLVYVGLVSLWVFYICWLYMFVMVDSWFKLPIGALVW